MGDIKGFLKVGRKSLEYRPVCERVKDYREVSLPKKENVSREQASRCMDCGVPFCQWGCPIGNLIPEWNDLVFHGHWEKALNLLRATNNLPEVTGRICPAPCEYSCVLGINDDPVTIRDNELAIIEYGFKKNLVNPNPPRKRTGKNVAIVGSGPSGLACADQLNQAGHSVFVFEKDDKAGGIMRYGIPDFKLDKSVLDRRIKILQEEGVTFITGINVGSMNNNKYINKDFDAVCLACGSRVPRDLNIEGRELSGIYFAMDYLVQANRVNAGYRIEDSKVISAKGKRVVVIGGGDTGADCVGVANRQGANCIIQIEVMPEPPACRDSEMPWPKYPLLLRTSTSHQEGGERKWAILTKKFIGQDKKVRKLSCVKVEFTKDSRHCNVMKEVPGSSFEIEADLVILALGFLHPEKNGLVKSLGLALDERQNIKTDSQYMTSSKGIFCAGDMRRGQSLIVWAISEGRRAAYCIDKFLMGQSELPII
ncbi:MAG: glutamate synthase subunit beta [Candidatus Omnitrophota bacterium]|jgi:glutamate synthase (NADPH/NADH) small chain|nr:MAG: glutamate synthase subunit beta [Candidatus Omnitrophota bacterium]